MIKNTLLAAAALATLVTGTIAAAPKADAGINITISGAGYGYGYGYGSRWRGYRYGYGHRPRDNWGGYPRYDTGHSYRSYRPRCRWKVKKVRVRTWDAYNNCWVTRKVRRRYRSCY